jgi:hypothetical protein
MGRASVTLEFPVRPDQSPRFGKKTAVYIFDATGRFRMFRLDDAMNFRVGARMPAGGP